MEQIGSLEQEKGGLKLAIKEVRGELQQDATDSEGEEDPHEFHGTGDAEEEQGGDQIQGVVTQLRREYGLDLYMGRKDKKPRTGTQEDEQEQMDI